MSLEWAISPKGHRKDVVQPVGLLSSSLYADDSSAVKAFHF